MRGCQLQATNDKSWAPPDSAGSAVCIRTRCTCQPARRHGPCCCCCCIHVQVQRTLHDSPHVSQMNTGQIEWDIHGRRASRWNPKRAHAYTIHHFSNFLSSNERWPTCLLVQLQSWLRETPTTYTVFHLKGWMVGTGFSLVMLLNSIIAVIGWMIHIILLIETPASGHVKPLASTVPVAAAAYMLSCSW